MSKKENQEKFESFKAEVLKWRNEHLLECKMFEKRMYENDGAPLLDVYKDVMMLLPSMVKKWKCLSSQPSTYELNHLDELVEGSSLASKLINDFKLNAVPKAGIILSWIFYGDFYEVIVSINEKYANDKKNLNLIERKICAFVAKSAVKSSIKAGYRTKEQWDDYYRTSQMLEDGDVLGWIKADLDKDIETEKRLTNRLFSKRSTPKRSRQNAKHKRQSVMRWSQNVELWKQKKKRLLQRRYLKLKRKCLLSLLQRKKQGQRKQSNLPCRKMNFAGKPKRMQRNRDSRVKRQRLPSKC